VITDFKPRLGSLYTTTGGCQYSSGEPCWKRKMAESCRNRSQGDILECFALVAWTVWSIRRTTYFIQYYEGWVKHL